MQSFNNFLSNVSDHFEFQLTSNQFNNHFIYKHTDDQFFIFKRIDDNEFLIEKFTLMYFLYSTSNQLQMKQIHSSKAQFINAHDIAKYQELQFVLDIMNDVNVKKLFIYRFENNQLFLLNLKEGQSFIHYKMQQLINSQTQNEINQYLLNWIEEQSKKTKTKCEFYNIIMKELYDYNEPIKNKDQLERKLIIEQEKVLKRVKGKYNLDFIIRNQEKDLIVNLKINDKEVTFYDRKFEKIQNIEQFFQLEDLDEFFELEDDVQVEEDLIEQDGQQAVNATDYEIQIEEKQINLEYDIREINHLKDHGKQLDLLIQGDINKCINEYNKLIKIYQKSESNPYDNITSNRSKFRISCNSSRGYSQSLESCLLERIQQDMREYLSEEKLVTVTSFSSLDQLIDQFNNQFKYRRYFKLNFKVNNNIIPFHQIVYFCNNHYYMDQEIFLYQIANQINQTKQKQKQTIDNLRKIIKKDYQKHQFVYFQQIEITTKTGHIVSYLPRKLFNIKIVKKIVIHSHQTCAQLYNEKNFDFIQQQLLTRKIKIENGEYVYNTRYKIQDEEQKEQEIQMQYELQNQSNEYQLQNQSDEYQSQNQFQSYQQLQNQFQEYELQNQFQLHQQSQNQLQKQIQFKSNKKYKSSFETDFELSECESNATISPSKSNTYKKIQEFTQQEHHIINQRLQNYQQILDKAENGQSFIYIIIFLFYDLDPQLQDDIKQFMQEKGLDATQYYYSKIGYSELVNDRTEKHFKTFNGKIYQLYKCKNRTSEQDFHKSKFVSHYKIDRKYIKGKVDGKSELYIFDGILSDVLKQNNKQIKCVEDLNDSFDQKQFFMEQEKSKSNKILKELEMKKEIELKRIDNEFELKKIEFEMKRIDKDFELKKICKEAELKYFEYKIKKVENEKEKTKQLELKQQDKKLIQQLYNEEQDIGLKKQLKQKLFDLL